MPQFIFISIAAGLLSAVLYAAAASGNALLVLPVYLSPLPLFMAGLSYGGIAALIGGVSGAASILLAGGPLLAVAYFVVNAAAPILLTRAANWWRETPASDGTMAIEWYPAGRLFAWLSALGAAILALLAVIAQSNEGGLEGWIAGIVPVDVIVQTILQARQPSGAPPIDEVMLRQQLIQFALPAMAIFWTLLMIANGALAQRLLSQLGWNARPSPGLLNMDLPAFMIWPLAGGLLMALLPGDTGIIGMGVAALAAVPYFFLGMATVHVISHRLPGRTFVLTGIYMLLLVAGWLCVFIASLGLVEHFIKLRRKYAVVKPY